MADDTLQMVGTTLRLINDELQRMDPTGTEVPSIEKVKGKGTDMVKELITLGAGKPPPSNDTPVTPTIAFLKEREKALLDAMKQLDTLTTVEKLRSRINALKSAVAVAQGRDPHP